MKNMKTVLGAALFCLALFFPSPAGAGDYAGDMALLRAYYAMDEKYEPDERSERLPELVPLAAEERRPVWDDVLTVLGHVLRCEYGHAVDVGGEIRDTYGVDRLGPFADAFLARQIGIGQWLSGEEDDARDSFESAFERYQASDIPFLRAEAACLLNAMGLILSMQDRCDEAAECFRRIARAFPADSDPDVAMAVAESLNSLGKCLEARGDITGAFDAYRSSAERCGKFDSRGFNLLLADNLLSLTLCCFQLDKDEEGLAYIQQLFNRFDGATEPRLRAAVAKGMLDKSMILLTAGRVDEARECLLLLLERYRDSRERAIEEVTSAALFTVGMCEAGAENHDAAIACFKEIEDRFSRYSDDSFVQRCALAMYNRGSCLASLGDMECAIEVFEQVIDVYRGHPQDEVQEVVAFAMCKKADTLVSLGRNDDAVEVCRLLALRYRHGENPTIQELVVNAEMMLSGISTESGRNDEALLGWERIADEYRDSDIPGVRVQVALAMLLRGTLLFELERHREAAVVLRDLFERFSEDTQPEIRVMVCQALFNQAAVACRNPNSYREAAAIYERVIHDYGKTDDPELLGPAVSAMLRSAELHSLLGERAMAEKRLCEARETVRGTEDPNLAELERQAVGMLSKLAHASDNATRKKKEDWSILFLVLGTSVMIASVIVLCLRKKR